MAMFAVSLAFAWPAAKAQPEVTPAATPQRPRAAAVTPPPIFANVRYGPDERNVTTSEKPSLDARDNWFRPDSGCLRRKNLELTIPPLRHGTPDPRLLNIVMADEHVPWELLFHR